MTTDYVRSLRAVLDDRLLAHDAPGGIRDAVDAVRSDRLDIDTLYTQVLAPLLVDTGAAWQGGETRVWEEHLATAMVRTIIESLYLDVQERASAAHDKKRTAVLACPAGEYHELGLRMLRDRMQLKGWNAIFLGADTPLEEIVAAARSFDADLVAISAATHYNRLMLRRVIDGLRERLPSTQIGVGGPAFCQDTAWPAEDLLTEAGLGLDDSGYSEQACLGGGEE